MEFQNNQQQIDFLPKSENVIYEKPDPAYRKVSILGAAIVSIVLLLAYFITAIFVEILLVFPLVWLVLLGWFIFTGLLLLWAVKSYKHQGYAIREKDILHKSGIFFRSTIIIPFNRIQHCEIIHGPIDRMFGLAEVSLFTAGGSSSDLVIPGLRQDKAAAIKYYITRKVTADEEE